MEKQMIKLLKNQLLKHINHLNESRYISGVMTEMGKEMGMSPGNSYPKGDLYAEKCFRYMYNGDKEKTEKYHRKFNEEYNNLLNEILFENLGDKTTFLIPKNVVGKSYLKEDGTPEEPKIDMGEGEASRIIGEKIVKFNDAYKEYYDTVNLIDRTYGYWKIPKRLEEFGKRSSNQS